MFACSIVCGLAISSASASPTHPQVGLMRVVGKSIKQLQRILGVPTISVATDDPALQVYRFDGSLAAVGVPHVEAGVNTKSGKIQYYSATFDDALDSKSALVRAGISGKELAIVERKRGHKTYVRVTGAAGLPGGWHVTALSQESCDKKSARGYTLVSVCGNSFQ